MKEDKTETEIPAEAAQTQKNIPLDMDGIIKMLFTLSDELTIRMINSLFNKDFPLDAELIFENNELYRFSRTEQRLEKFQTDIVLRINGERFHIELQTVNDGSMVIRTFEYGFLIAISEIKSSLVEIKTLTPWNPIGRRTTSSRLHSTATIISLAFRPRRQNLAAHFKNDAISIFCFNIA